MRIIGTQTENSEVSTHSSDVLAEASPITHKSYHEMADRPVVETDALARLHANIEMLTDLSGRLSFVMKEVRYLLKV